MKMKATQRILLFKHVKLKLKMEVSIDREKHLFIAGVSLTLFHVLAAS